MLNHVAKFAHRFRLWQRSCASKGDCDPPQSQGGYINGVLVEQVDSVKYLGHFLTNELSDDIDIRRQCLVLNVRGNMLCRKFHMCSVRVKLKLFNSYCSSLYTPYLWWNYRKMSVTKLQITFHNTCYFLYILKRNIGISKYDSTSATCAFTNTQCCQSTIRNLIFKFMCRLNKSDNALIKALMASSVVYTSRINSHWRRLLYGTIICTRCIVVTD